MSMFCSIIMCNVVIWSVQDPIGNCPCPILKNQKAAHKHHHLPCQEGSASRALHRSRCVVFWINCAHNKTTLILCKSLISMWKARKNHHTNFLTIWQLQTCQIEWKNDSLNISTMLSLTVNATD